jgi:hypothetical protein
MKTQLPAAGRGATRRTLISLALAAPVAALGSAAAAQAVCVDMDALSSSQKSMRATLGFRLVSDDPKRHCRDCAFFTADAGDCGHCALLSGGPVPGGGRCDSWAMRK